MKRVSAITLAVAIAAVPAVYAAAQNAYVAAAGESGYTQVEPAPIERPGQAQGYAVQQTQPLGATQGAQGNQGPQPPDVMATHPSHGVTVLADSATEVKTVAADAQHTELRLERGVANVIVRDPAPDMLLLVDLPGGQVQLLENGFYTFNADTNTARVLSGKADAFAASRDKAASVKDGDQAVFVADSARVSYSDPYNIRADVLAAPMSHGGQGYGAQAYGDTGYAAPAYEGFYGGYGDGFYGGYPYYAYGYPYYGWGYPGWGYGLGFGYGWGGGYGYGFRGGYGGRFPGSPGNPHPLGGLGGGGFHGGGGGFHGAGGGHR